MARGEREEFVCVRESGRGQTGGVLPIAHGEKEETTHQLSYALFSLCLSPLDPALLELMPLLRVPLKSLFAASLKAAASAKSSADGVAAVVAAVVATGAAASAPPLGDSSMAAVVPADASEDTGETGSLFSPLAVISMAGSGGKSKCFGEMLSLSLWPNRSMPPPLFASPFVFFSLG